MVRRKKVGPEAAFNGALRLALENFHDPAGLGTNSILAMPYYLGAHLRPDGSPAGPRRRGQILQSLLRAAAADLWPDALPAGPKALQAAVDQERITQGNAGPCYAYYLLELRYFRQYFPSRTYPTTVAAIPDFVGVSSTRFFVHLEKAIGRLGECLLARIQPTLRLACPLPAGPLVGRDHEITAITADLAGSRSVAVSGVGGVGKTTLGAAVAQAWAGDRAFWYTIHPGLNDDLDSMLFALGHFMNRRGASALWLHLLAGEGKTGNLETALGFLREDLQRLRDAPPLFCFDEVDLLHTAGQEPRKRSHIQTLEFLDSLGGLVSLLLIGQRALIDTNTHYTLHPLDQAHTEQLLNQAGVHLPLEQLQQVHQFTAGNPRQLELYAALYYSGDPAQDILQLAGDPAAQPLFHRLWKRLDNDERFLLGSLSVLRAPAPREAWPEHQHALQSLVQRRLVKLDLGGGVVLLPFFCQLIVRDLLPEHRQRFHEQAALLRAQGGEYTAAAYHFWRADQAAAAVRSWFPHMKAEIRRGRTQAAMDIFHNVSPAALTGREKKELKVIQNRLYLLTGEAEHILEGMESFTWHPDEEITADALNQWGLAYAVLGRNEAAVEKFDEAVETLGRIAEKIAGQHFHRGQLFLLEADFEAARREIVLAQFDVDHMRGMVEQAARNFAQAKAIFRQALEKAEAVGEEHRAARMHHLLLQIAGRQARPEEAGEHARWAMAYYRKIGSRQMEETIRGELAAMLVNLRRFEEVIEPAGQALHFFEQINHERWISALCNNLAEAYLETGRPDKAREYAYRVLRMEVPRSLPYAHYTLGLAYEREQDIDNAETTFRQGIQIAQQNQDRFIEAYLLRALGQLYAARGDGMLGYEHLQEALDLFQSMGIAPEIAATQGTMDMMRM